jgi:DNA-binding NtrC family response regulator
MVPDSILVAAAESPDDRNVIVEALGDQFNIRGADTFEDALTHLANGSDLVIGDLDSRRINGLELLLRWKARRPGTPFLFFTDGRDVAGAIEVMKGGAADCLIRPLDPDELRTTALSVVGARDSTSKGISGKPDIDIPPGTSLEDLERAAVQQALVQHHGNRTHAAKTLGISVRTLQRKLKAWGLPLSSFHNPPDHHSPQNGFVLPDHGAPTDAFSVHVH